MKNIATKYYVPSGLSQESIVISGGGYIGEWDEWLYRKYGPVLCIFEPFFENMQKIKDRFKQMWSGRVVYMKAALSNVDGMTDLHLVDGKSSGHSLFDRSADKKQIESVE